MDNSNQAPPQEWAPLEDLRDWADLKVTAVFLDQLQQEQAGMLKGLLSRCRETTDPRVARSIGWYDAITGVIDMVEGDSD